MSRRWKSISGGGGGDVDEWIKWQKAGEEIIVKLVGFVDGRYGKNAVAIRESDGKRVGFGLSAALRDLESIELGSTIRIRFLGWQETAQGVQFKNFDVDVAEDDSGEPAPGNFAASADDVPFAREEGA